jgi:hypothetical protein
LVLKSNINEEKQKKLPTTHLEKKRTVYRKPESTVGGTYCSRGVNILNKRERRENNVKVKGRKRKDKEN